MGDSKNYIIQIKDAYKRYGNKNVILRGLNMSVEKGVIYGLLGPSGCGKTTLLSCVGGLILLDSGSITVNLTSRKQLGYMPQDIALMDLFTVSEILQYFGKINGLPSSKVEEKGHNLLELMELPAEKFWTRVIGSLSGGQQRRISLTVALLHDPQLLILDEPTVGLDPIISDKLWKFFTEISAKYEKTLIITTHYIEEARQANMIGLMRSGILLAEDSPTKLLEDFKCNTLEDVFLLLSHKQSIVCIENEESYPSKSLTKKPFGDGTMWDRKRLGAQIFKNTCWIKRNIPIMLFMLLLPTLLIILFCTVYSDYLRGVNIAVVSEEMLPGTCSHPPESSPPPRKCKPDSRLSCRILPLFRETTGYTLVEHKTLESAKLSVANGEARGLIHFDKNYSWSLIRRLDSGPLFTPDRYVNASLIKVYLDMAEVTVGFKIRKDIIDGFEELAKVVTKECNFKVGSTGSVLKFEKPIHGFKSPRFIDSSMPGFIIPFVFYLTTSFSSSAVVSEKNSGFLDRCLIAGVHHNEILFAIGVTQVLMVIGQNILILTIAYVGFQLPMEGSWSLILIFFSLAEIQGMLFGFCLGTLFTEERNVTYCAVGTVTCLFFTSGMFWPLEGAHWVIQKQMMYFPIMMAVESYRSITIRGWGLANPLIPASILTNIGLVIVLLLLFMLISKHKHA
ncbi:ABC transporter G family member 23-like [Macrosteles quadrilineatus]|uniref:ABC transporter G family member 23-like n=1 Tax=Macrosteles quadrilineatus TaxID=74068 RepID=UPI0023E0AF30|nr:ABC transporter G family member 23-like [Macrosteles quadrilineatus]